MFAPPSPLQVDLNLLQQALPALARVLGFTQGFIARQMGPQPFMMPNGRPIMPPMPLAQNEDAKTSSNALPILAKVPGAREAIDNKEPIVPATVPVPRP